MTEEGWLGATTSLEAAVQWARSQGSRRKIRLYVAACGRPAADPLGVYDEDVRSWQHIDFARAGENGGAMSRVAQSIYGERCFGDLPILADALEAGCQGEEVLAHCRQARIHVRGCWVVDWVGKQE